MQRLLMSRAYGNQRFDAVDIRCQQSREMAEPLISENQSRCREIESRRWLTQRAACTRCRHGATATLVGRFAVRVFRQFTWLEVGSVKAALPRPAHQYPAGA